MTVDSTSAASRSAAGHFLLSKATLDAMASGLVKQALGRGASDAVARVSESDQLLVQVRDFRPETLEKSQRQVVSLTVYNGSRSGSARTSDLSPKALSSTLDAAWHIAKYTGSDSWSGPAEADLLETSPLDLELYQARSPEAEEAIEAARRAERAAMTAGAAIANSNGARVSVQHGQFSLATSRGFVGGYAHSSHALACSVIAANAAGMQDGEWGMARRRYADLDAPETIGRTAARRALDKLDARPLKTERMPVLFEASVAASLVGSLVAAISGQALYLGRSFLTGSLGQLLLPEHVDLHETPHERRGLASAPFDDEGVRTRAREVIKEGVLQGYFLSTYAARRLAMPCTGHAGGPYNLSLFSSRTAANDGLDAMVRRLHRGLLVTEFMGHGVNPVTGDYSRGVSGFWVEGGEIQHPVHEVTVSGNLKRMFLDIAAIGADVHMAPTRTGSILVDSLLVAGR